MCPTLALGVIDIPYSDAPTPDKPGKETAARPRLGGSAKKAAAMNQRKAAAHITTGDVAKILEKKYHILETLVAVHGQDIADDLANAYMGAFETFAQTGRMPLNPGATAEKRITERMKDWISTQEVERQGLAGVPTQAALDGVNHRLKHPYASNNPRRPSFKDTSLMEGSYVAWVKP